MLRRCSIFKTMKNLLRNKINLNYARTTFQNHADFKYRACTSVIIKQHQLFNFKWLLGISFLTTLWYNTTEKDDAEDNLAHLITLAKIALERGDVTRAQDILLLGLNLSEEHKLYTTIPYLYDILATISLSQGNIKGAEELLVTAIEKLTIWGFADDHYNIIDFKLRLARIYSATGDEAYAKIGFETCLNQQRTKILNGDTSEKTGILYVNILFWYGVHKMRHNEYDEARCMVNTAYEFSTKIKGLSPKQEMVLMFTLADLNAELGDYKVALSSMLNAIVLGKSIGSTEMPMCYMKLGRIYEKLGFVDQAMFAYNEALKSANMFGFYDLVTDAENALIDLKMKKDEERKN